MRITGTNGRELWKCEGPRFRDAVMIEDIHRDLGCHPSDLTGIGDVLFFCATDDTHGKETWKCDGPDYKDPVMLKDIFSWIRKFRSNLSDSG